MGARRVTVFGGSGFIGRHLVQRLAADGWRVRVAVRDPEAAMFLMPLGDVGQIVAVKANVCDAESVRAAIDGADAVVNLVGILYERGSRTFQAVHVEGARTVAAAAKAAGVERLVHMSALGADPAADAAYARTKAEGEDAVRGAFPEATVIRPSVVFGPEDGFFNRFAQLARLSPVLPVFTADGPRLRLAGLRPVLDLFGSGGPRFQPVYVGDVAEAMARCLRDGRHAGQTFEFGGPTTYTMRQVMELVLRETGRRRLLAPVPFAVAAVEAFFLQFWPKPLLTPDQVRLLRRDNVVSGALPGLEALGILPTAAEVIVPTYLQRHRPAGQQTAAGRRRPRA